MTPIVIAFTPNYIVQAACTVHSVLGSSSSSFEFICLLTEPLPDGHKQLLSEMCGERASFKYLSPSGLPDDVYVDPRYGLAAEFRLLLPELLPDYDKVIYVDCDVIVRNDLAQLYASLDLSDDLLAAVYEAPIEDQADRWRALGCNPDRYFNSGFLVMNLRQMRREGTSARLISALQGTVLEFPDQDALNLVCAGRVKALPPRYNAIRTFRLPQYRDDFLHQYSEAELRDVLERGTVHYTGGKPWNILAVSFELWWKEYYSLPPAFRSLWKPSSRILLLSRLYMCPFFRRAIEGSRSAFRKIRTWL